jgi:hypothetical protein
VYPCRIANIQNEQPTPSVRDRSTITVTVTKLALKAAVKVGAKVVAREISYDEAKQLGVKKRKK